jgi:hypothetical protein
MGLEMKHDELREKLDTLNVMYRNDGAQLVTEVLKYIMDNAEFRTTKSMEEYAAIQERIRQA